MQNKKPQHGHFSWNELLTTNLDSAKEFYGELLGWTFNETQTIYGETYLIALKDDTMVGGMLIKPDDVPESVKPCWDPYITVNDVDETAAKVEELGGKVMLAPTDITNVGRFCVIRDRQGVYLNLITYFN